MATMAASKIAQSTAAGTTLRMLPEDQHTFTATSWDGDASSNADLAEYDEEQVRLMDERCLLVDEQDNPIGSASKKACHLMENINRGLLHRAFSVFLFDRDNRLLLQRRSPEKITFPSMWTNTCCSHPLVPAEVGTDMDSAIEGARRAAQRKLQHELNIPAHDTPLNEFTFLGRIYYQAPSDGKWGEHEIDYIFLIKTHASFSLNPNEVCDAKYVSQAELHSMLKDGEVKLTPWFQMICEKGLLFEWWNDLREGAAISREDASIKHLT